MKEDLDDAFGVITKLEQARIILNKLMGPEGAITEAERKKFNLQAAGQQNKKKKPTVVKGNERELRE